MEKKVVRESCSHTDHSKVQTSRIIAPKRCVECHKRVCRRVGGCVAENDM